VIIISGLTVLACKMNGKMGSADLGRKIRSFTRSYSRNYSQGQNFNEIELKIEPIVLSKPSYPDEPARMVEEGALSIPMAVLDFGAELKDTGLWSLAILKAFPAFSRTYKGAWQGKTVIIKKLHTESLTDDKIKSAISEVILLMYCLFV